jgi:hypothetical protein
VRGAALAPVLLSRTSVARRCSPLLRRPHLQVWFYQVKATACCTELRLLLGCDIVDLISPCRGFLGDCGDLQEQFQTLPPEVLEGANLVDYECHAFPDDDKPIDQFFVGLIFVAVAIPMRFILGPCTCQLFFVAQLPLPRNS